MITATKLFASISLLSLIACAAPTASDDPAPAPASDDPAAVDPADPSASSPSFGSVPETEVPAGPPARPAPQSAIRSCGTARTTPMQLDTEARWVDFHPVKLGAKVMTATPVLLGGQVVSGAATRVATSTTSRSKSGPDLADGDVASTLGLHFASSTSPQIENYPTSATMTPESAWYLRPTNLRLSFFAGFSASEVGWSIDAPRRTSLAATGDTFVRGVEAGIFAGYAIALEFPSACALGALSDALGQPAQIGDAVTSSGIFTPSKAADVESTLVANGVVMRIQYIGSKKLPAVESAFATTTCSPANIAECSKLVASLVAAGQAFRSAANTPSNQTMLQSNTDPVWSPMSLSSAPIATAL